MKLSVRFVSSLFLILMLGGSWAPAAQPADKAVPVKEAPGTAKKIEEEDGEVLGMAIARPGGRWIGVTMQGLNLKLTFYNQKKKPEKVDVLRGTVRWKLPTLPETERGVLTLAPDGVSLVGNQPMRKPWVYSVTVVLVNAKEEASETYQFMLNEAAMAPKPPTPAKKS